MKRKQKDVFCQQEKDSCQNLFYTVNLRDVLLEVGEMAQQLRALAACSSIGPGFHSQCLQSSSQLSVASVSENLTSSSNL